MAVPEYNKEELSEKDKRYIKMRSIMDIGMGLLWLAMGVFLIFIRYFNTGLEARFDDSTMKVFGGICSVYGVFRIYRGFKQNYLTER